MKRAWRIGLTVALLCAGLAAATGFLVATTPGLAALAAAASALSGGRLVFAGVEGTLAGSFGIGRVRVELDTQRIELEDLHLAWRPRALFDGVLDLERIEVRVLRVRTTRPDDTPVAEPASLRLPFDVRVERIELARFEHTGADGAGFRLDALAGRLDGRGARWRLAGLRANTPWGAARGTLELGKDAPFALAARLDATLAAPQALRAQATLAGTLAAPRFAVQAGEATMRLHLAGEVAPFAKVRLVHLLVVGEGIDPRRFAATAPAAELAFSGVFEGRPGERVFGSFSLHNRRPGRLDEARLPLTQLTGALLGNASEANFSDLAVDLGRVGTLTGTGAWRAGRFELAFDGDRLDLAGLHRDLAATRLGAHLELAGDGARQTLAGTLRESWGQGRFALFHADRVLALTAADFSGAAGRLVAHGAMRLDAGQSFAVNFEAKRIDPARFGRFPRGRLDARGEARGAFAPTPMLDLQLDLPPGELEGRAVRGVARLRYADAHLADSRIDLDLAGNRVSVEGAWGRAGDRLVWDIDAPQLARLQGGFAGSLTSRGTLSDAPAAPALELRAEAAQLRLPGGVSVAALDAHAKLVATADGAFEGRIEARGLDAGGWRAETARARLAGRRDAHTLSLDARLPGGEASAAFAGGLDATQTWHGQLRAAEASGAWPLRLIAPATLALSRTRQQANDLAFVLAGGRVEVETLRRDGHGLVTRGRFGALPVAPVLDRFAPSLPVRTDLRLNGRWALALGEKLEGEAQIERASGDVRLSEPAQALDLTRLDAQLTLAANTAQIVAGFDTRDGGRGTFDAQAPLAVEAGVLGIDRAAPLAWRARLELPDLRRARPFLPLGMRLDARLAARLEGSGSLAAPKIAGEARAENIRFALPEEGISVESGTLDFVLDGDRVRVRQGELKGRSGRILVRGEAELANPRAGLALDFEKFDLLHRSDRRLVVSGDARLTLVEKSLKLDGRFVADRARLEMPAASRPELSPDVLVAGAPRRDTPATARYPLALDLALDLGDDFLFQGAGLDAKLGGRLRVVDSGDGLRGEGTIRVTKGRYAAYTQTLDIERGILRFAGPLGDPGLDILAVRKTPTVTAGVQVRGSAQRPAVTLYSDPAMADTEKLAWLVLGHGLDSAGQQEFVLMQVAAGALLGQAESLNFQARLADTLGIDSLDVRAGEGETLGTAIVSVGKRLSSRATISYERSVDGLNQAVKALYQLTPRVRLEAQSSELRNSFDAVYTLEYD